ncbi:MAG: hypothetical protein LBI87_15270 [Candidatus Accumulibacter sp.]|nr:hypothetical protein [Accumulibacter sp.]
MRETISMAYREFDAGQLAEHLADRQPAGRLDGLAIENGFPRHRRASFLERRRLPADDDFGEPMFGFRGKTGQRRERAGQGECPARRAPEIKI